MSALIGQAITRRQAVPEEELLAAAEHGQHILQLRRERDNLPDTVALAIAPAGLRQLWARLLHLLGEEPTTLLPLWQLRRQLLLALSLGAGAGVIAYAAGPWMAGLLSALAAFASTLRVQARRWLQLVWADATFPPATS